MVENDRQWVVSSVAAVRTEAESAETVRGRRRNGGKRGGERQTREREREFVSQHKRCNFLNLPLNLVVISI